MRDHHQDCADALERIYPFLDGELGAWRRWRVRRHLRACRPCDGLYAFEDRLKAVIRERSGEAVPDEVVERLQQFLRDHDCEC